MKTCPMGHEFDGTGCLVCRKERYQSNREKDREDNRQWIQNNLDRYREIQKKYRQDNPDKIKQLYAEWVEGHPFHSIWRTMKARCYSPTNPKYKDYGARGIKICDRWLGDGGYTNFETDMGPRPTPKHSIERKSNDGNYEPGNCVWATPKAQQRNRRGNRMVTISGVTKCMAEWVEISGLNFKTLQKRVDNGWPEEELLIPADQRYRNSGRTGHKIHA